VTLDQFIGIPYQNRGSSFKGCDCWGLVWLFHRHALNQEIPRYEGYADAESPSMRNYIVERWNAWVSVELANIELGDVLALKVGGLPVHCGVYAGHGRMLHVLEGRMSCLEPVARGLWKNAIVRIGRWKS
jgi:cell wall-associated NlpC family hydrolase